MKDSDDIYKYRRCDQPTPASIWIEPPLARWHKSNKTEQSSTLYLTGLTPRHVVARTVNTQSDTGCWRAVVMWLGTALSVPVGHTLTPVIISDHPHTDIGHFPFWISLSLRPKTENKRLNFGLSPEFRLTNHRGAHHCSLRNVIADVIADISVGYFFVYIWINEKWSHFRLTHLVQAKSTDELISFGFSDRSVRSLVSANRWV